MVARGYLSGRTKYSRPQAMIWSDVAFDVVDDPEHLLDGGFVPPDYAVEGEDFIVITDHNRDSISMSPTRIESRERMIDGTSRSYYTTDKLKLSTSWTLLPSRIAATPVVFDNVTGDVSGGTVYVADDASAALDLKQWYETHPGSFYVYLSYDQGAERDNSMKTYTDFKRMFFESFSSTLSKRGLYDMWDISVSLDES